MLEPALLFLSWRWQLLVCFLAAALSGSTALSLPRKQLFSVISHCVPHPGNVCASLRAPQCLRGSSSALCSAWGCRAMADAAATALPLPQPGPQHQAGHSPPAPQPAPPQEQPFLGQFNLTVWVKWGEFVPRCAGRGFPPPSPQPPGLLLPGAGGGCGVKGLSWVTCTQN